ncbi:MAG: winged helix-turn-helix transcriptional regulator [Woeseiaceae bacterium]
MKTFGQFCPLAQAAQLLCERWTLLVVRELVAGSTRFNDLQRGVPLMSPSLLSARLKQLTAAGVVEKTGSKGKQSYQLTKAGQELAPIVKELGAWGHRWVRTSLVVEDLDASLLMWDMRRSVKPEAFPQHRIVLQFEYPDASKGATDWWLVSENGEVELCLNEPGGDVDVVVRSPLANMTAVWTCQKPFEDAVADGEIEVFGDKNLISSLPDWLQASGLSQLGHQSMQNQI